MYIFKIKNSKKIQKKIQDFQIFPKKEKNFQPKRRKKKL